MNSVLATLRLSLLATVVAIDEDFSIESLLFAQAP
jgi:hypothetical protein